MSNLHNDIDDDEIRIILPDSSRGKSSPRAEAKEEAKAEAKARTIAEAPRRRKWRAVLLAAVAVVAVAIALYFLLRPSAGKETGEELVLVNTGTLSDDAVPADSAATAGNAAAAAVTAAEKGHVLFTDTVVNNVPLAIFRPVNATPRLEVGTAALNDSNAIMILQAADIRRDNGKIVGAYVLRGELLSKGQAKSGYCAIIGGNLTIGVADSTPLLEQAIESDGYFFRQYPLVVANQIVENKPKNSSLRRALAEIDGHIAVILSRRNMTFHDFSQALVDLGVTNAIYLVGSGAHGFAVDADGNRIQFGTVIPTTQEYANYIIWE